MIYPYELPNSIKSNAEKKVFNQLYEVRDKYDIFYSKRFINRTRKEKSEYEIDFIIADKPERRSKCKAIFCIEIKGGLIEYDGDNNEWLQNGKKMDKNPDVQVSSYSHSIINRYKDISKNVPIEWALCFPDCEIPENAQLPTNLEYNKVIDARSALYIEEKLDSMIDNVKSKYSKDGCSVHEYEDFKKSILRGIGFIESLSTKFKYEDKRFIKLSNAQIDIFNLISENKNIHVSGYAGTGKTIIAIAAAQEKLDNNNTVLFLCYNRTLANKIRYRFNKYDDRIKVATYHSLAREKINAHDPSWWNKHISKDDDKFWSLEVPMKFDSVIDDNLDKYDAIIIDEGQDFKELWFESIFKFCKNDGYKYVFTDPLQDIFFRKGRLPKNNEFFNYNLKQNCRNTKNIVSYLSETVNEHIPSHHDSPSGERVSTKVFKTKEDLINTITAEITSLIKHHGVQPEQILLMPNSPINESSIDELWSVGKVPVTNLKRSGRFDKGKIHYASINLFKGLEIEILFIIDADRAPDVKTLYTQISRGKNKVYIFNLAD